MRKYLPTVTVDFIGWNTFGRERGGGRNELVVVNEKDLGRNSTYTYLSKVVNLSIFTLYLNYRRLSGWKSKEHTTKCSDYNCNKSP